MQETNASRACVEFAEGVFSMTTRMQVLPNTYGQKQGGDRWSSMQWCFQTTDVMLSVFLGNVKGLK